MKSVLTYITWWTKYQYLNIIQRITHLLCWLNSCYISNFQKILRMLIIPEIRLPYYPILYPHHDHHCCPPILFLIFSYMRLKSIFCLSSIFLHVLFSVLRPSHQSFYGLPWFGTLKNTSMPTWVDLSSNQKCTSYELLTAVALCMMP